VQYFTFQRLKGAKAIHIFEQVYHQYSLHHPTKELKHFQELKAVILER
jgi:hypothetical protein